MKNTWISIREICLRNTTRAQVFCFIGMDGSGKTTLTKAVERRLNAHKIPYYYIWAGWRGFESFLFKPFVRQYKKRYSARTDFSSFEKKTMFFMMFVLIDYIVRILPEVVRAYSKKGMILMDRSFYDVIINNTRHKNFQKNCVRVISRLMPRCCIFYVDVPHAIAYERKKAEFGSIENAKLLYDRYHHLISLISEVGGHTVIGINNSRPFERVEEEVVEYILRHRSP